MKPITKVCSYPGCKELTEKTRCQKHEVVKPERHRRPEQRESAYKRGYTRDWQEYRKVFLAEHPWCTHCQSDRRMVPAKEVDHIIPHRGDMTLFWDTSNHQGLCKQCHSRKTAREDGGFGNGR